MAMPKNVRGSAERSPDPLLDFKFLIRWDKRLVAGVSKVSALKRTTKAEELVEGGAPHVTRRMPGQTAYEDITLESGLIIDSAFEDWASKVWHQSGGLLGTQVSLEDFRKDVTIQVCNQAGQVVRTYVVFNCWPTEYQALPDLDAKSNDVALETLKLANEGWEREKPTSSPPALPQFNAPDA